MSETSGWQFVGKGGTYAIACNDEEAVFATEHGLGSVGRTDDKLLHVRVSERPCDGKHSVDAVVHHEASGVRDAFRLLSVRALVVVGESNRLTIPTVDHQKSVSNVSVHSEWTMPLHLPEHGPSVTDVGGVQHPLGRLSRLGLFGVVTGFEALRDLAPQTSAGLGSLGRTFGSGSSVF